MLLLAQRWELNLDAVADVAPGSNADVARALKAAGERLQADLLASLPQEEEEEDDEDDGDYVG